MLLFRNMTLQDIPEVSHLENNASPHPWKSSHYEESIHSGHICRVAELQGTIIAQAVISTVADEASLLILTVSSEHQGNGYGQAMLHDVIKQAGTTARTMFLEVRNSNIKAFNLYLKKGFSEVGRRPGYYPATPTSKSEDAIVMIRDLSFDNSPD